MVIFGRLLCIVYGIVIIGIIDNNSFKKNDNYYKRLLSLFLRIIGIANIVIKNSNNCKNKHNGTTVYGNKGAVFKNPTVCCRFFQSWLVKNGFSQVWQS